jgi:hypothetical protein
MLLQVLTLQPLLKEKEKLTMDTSNLYPSKYVGSDDLKGNHVTVTIRELKLESLKDRNGLQQMKPVLYFQKTEKGLVVNKTNLKSLWAIFSSKSSKDWIGKKISLYSTPVQVGDEMRQGIRISKPESNGNGAANKVEVAPALDPDDDVPDSFEPPDDATDEENPFA